MHMFCKHDQSKLIHSKGGEEILGWEFIVLFVLGALSWEMILLHKFQITDTSKNVYSD